MCHKNYSHLACIDNLQRFTPTNANLHSLSSPTIRPPARFRNLPDSGCLLHRLPNASTHRLDPNLRPITRSISPKNNKQKTRDFGPPKDRSRNGNRHFNDASCCLNRNEKKRFGTFKTDTRVGEGERGDFVNVGLLADISIGHCGPLGRVCHNRVH